MKAKLIPLLISCIFIFTGLTSVASTEIETNFSKSSDETNNDLPDLTIQMVLKDNQFYPNLKWDVYVYIYNEGTTSVLTGETIIFCIRENDEGSGNCRHIELERPLGPGERVIYDEYFVYPKISNYPGSELAAVVDPTDVDYPWADVNPDPEYGVIKESNENNNRDTMIFPKVKSKNLFIFKFFERFQLFARLLNL